MWDGPGPGPRQRGGPPFRGNQRGEMFGGRDHPMPNFRGRDDMNMGSMGLMGPRPLDLPPMDMRRMDGPPMRGRGMESCDMRGREANRDAMRWGEKPDFSLRKQFESSIREKLMNSTGFMGPNRDLSDMDGRGNAPWDQHNKFNDIRERDSFHPNMPQFNNPNGNGRRGFPPDRMNTHDGFRDMHQLPPMGSGEGDRYNMNFPPHERRRMDFDRRGGPPFDSRGEFDSDMDFRNRPEPSADFRARDRSPLRFGGSSVGSADRRGPDMPSNVPGPQQLGFTSAGDSPRDGTCQESGGSPLMDYRCGEEMTLAEEWKKRQKDKSSFGNVAKGIGEICEPSFPLGFGRDINVRDSLSFQDRGRPSGDFPKNEMHFPRDGHFPVNSSPQIGGNGPQENQPLDRGRFTAPFGRNDESKRWLEERHPKDNQNKSQESSKEPNERFEALEDGQCTTGAKLGLEHDFQSSSNLQVKDQDYRDIDYRTGSVRTFDYKHDELPPTEKLIPESKPVPPSKFNESGCQDQDYRSASVEDKVSNTISIIGIPKTATMEQILGAFVVRDGVPLQGMKVKNVVPGYSYDTAYVEFLNLEDAVHFMESNKVAHPRLSTEAVSHIRITKGLKKGLLSDGKGGESGNTRITPKFRLNQEV